MVRSREIPRAAAFAWSPGAASPWIATGTKSGAVDDDFSTETCLELWDLALDDVSQGPELKPTVTIAADARFHDLAWTQVNETHKKGVIAGALENGSLDLWDADHLLSGEGDALISSTKKHSGAIKTLQFNPKHSNLVATGGAKGELFVTDLNNASSSIRLGSAAARADDIECLDWNKKVSHIMVTGSAGGFVTVWDMKTKKESLTLNNLGRKPVSAVAWDPEKATKLITATPLEDDPLILVWDLRNSNAPERTLRGHDSGVLSLSWCPQDSDLLLSCGRDNRTICWNPQTGEPYGEFPVVTSWTFQTRWNPHNPNLFATASFDGKLSVQTLQNTNSDKAQVSTQNQSLDGEDFFSKAQTQPQTSSFSLSKAPKWFERPISASFGFGGMLISVRSVEPGKSRTSRIDITKFEIDADVGTATDNFEKDMQSGDLNSICQTKIAEASSKEEKADWKVIESLISSNPRKNIVDYLGFNDRDEAVDGVAKNSSAPQRNGVDNKGEERFSSMFDSTGDDDFLSELAATKGTKTNNPFHISDGSEPEADRRITRALLLGQFEKALDVCLQEDRMSDAFMVAICGGEACIKKAQAAYFSRQSGSPNYLRLLTSVVGKNLWDVVHNADLENWKEVMATLCTFADEKEFPDLCEALGDRLEDRVKVEAEARKNASFCYLVGSKLEKVVAIWIEELLENEAAGASDGFDGSAFSLHARGLQNLIEKVTVFRKVTNFQDPELSKNADWKLDSLYSKYVEYADIVAAHGQLAIAEKYLDLLPAKYPEADVARSRIKQATKKTTAAAVQTKPESVGRQKPLPAVGGYQPLQNNFVPANPPTSTPYAPPAPSQPANPYAPSAPSHATNPYAPSGGYQPPQQMRGPGTIPPPPQSFNASRANPVPPPRVYNQSPAIPAPSKATNMTNWNDIPDNFVKPPTSRRGTPSIPQPPVTSPYSAQPPMSSQTPSVPVAPFGSRQRATPPPPPKGPAPPPRVTSPLAGIPTQSFQPPERPSSTSAYAPQPTMSSPQVGHQVGQTPNAQGNSHYNAPPAAAPAPNRYAPAPSTQPAAKAGRPPVGPPPPSSSYQPASPPVNPYAASQQQQPTSTSSPYAPMSPQLQQARPAQIRTPAPPPAMPAGPATISPSSTASPELRASKATSTKHSSGDRTHIPAKAQPIHSILSSEMARVKARAPSSFKAHVVDAEKRLNRLFDHLNNQELLKPDTVSMMVELSQALEARDFERASALQMDIYRDKVDECGDWMVGVKRLVGMSRATP